MHVEEVDVGDWVFWTAEANEIFDGNDNDNDNGGCMRIFFIFWLLYDVSDDCLL